MNEHAEDQVILVDEQDQELGYMDKMQAHIEGKLHRAFSVFIFNTKGELLLQRRALDKYHSAGLWTNTCCSHPRPHETVIEASIRRTKEEMGIDCSPYPLFTFTYQVQLEKGLTEHEFDHVLVADWEGNPEMNTREVMDWKWTMPDVIIRDMALHPYNYTYWFRELLEQVIQYRKTV